MILDEPYCAICGRNANSMLEIHHILGRVSNSVFNASLLCKHCHDKVTMSKEEQIRLVKRTWQVIQQHSPDYKITHNDLEFFNKISKRWGIPISEIIKEL